MRLRRLVHRNIRICRFYICDRVAASKPQALGMVGWETIPKLRLRLPPFTLFGTIHKFACYEVLGCLALFLIFSGLGCGTNNSASEKVRVKSSKERGEALNQTLLHLAPNGHVAERLIADGADVNAGDSFGMTPLHTAVKEGHSDVVEVLIAHGADVNAKSHRGQTPLFWAIVKESQSMAERLIAYGADVNATDDYGVSPLHSAARLGKKDFVEILLVHDADVAVKDNEGRSPLDLAKTGGHTEIVVLLLKQGAKE